MFKWNKKEENKIEAYEDNFKSWLIQKEYKKCSNFIKNKIIEYVVNIIKQIDEQYEYSGIENLIEVSRKYIEGREKYIAEYIEVESYEETPLEELKRLMDLCKEFNIR